MNESPKKSLAEILREAEALEAKCSAHFESFKAAKADAYKRAGEATKSIVTPIFEALDPLAEVGRRLEDESEAVVGQVSPHLEDGELLLFAAAGSDDVRAAYLDEKGDLVIREAQWASDAAGSAEPPAKPESKSDESTSLLEAVKDGVRDVLKSRGFNAAVETVGDICPCPKCTARREARASAASATVGDQAVS